MKPHRLLLSVGLLSTVSGCHIRVRSDNPEKELSKVWMYQPGTIKEGKVDSLLSYTNFIELRPDGGFSSYLGKFATGTWSFESKTQKLHLVLAGGRRFEIPVNRDASGRLVLGFASLAIPRFTPHPIPGLFHADDPFAPANNQWRVRAKARETDQQIRGRLISHCHFWVAYFKWADNYDVELEDLRSIPSPIKIYGNGFGLTHFQDEPRPWTVNFYDTADSRKAYDLLRRVFSKNDIKWPNTDNDYKRFADGFEQVEEWIKKDGERQ